MYNFTSPSDVVWRMPGAGSAINLAIPIINGNRYMKQEPDVPYTCEGCVASGDASLCKELSLGSTCYDVIWVRAESPLQQYHAALEQDIG